MEFSMNMQELSMVELQNIDGGSWWQIAAGVGIIVGTLAVAAAFPATVATPAGMKVAEATVMFGVAAISYGIIH